MKPAVELEIQDASGKPAAQHLSLVQPAGGSCELPVSPKGRTLKAGALLALLGLSCLAAFLWMADGGAWLTGSLPNIWSRIIAQVGQVILVINVLALLWRVYLVLTYKPVPECASADLPALTVVIPAYNEGRQVADTMFSVAASDYPADKLQIIAVDDGSQDDTWLWMQRANAEMPGRFTLIRQPRNMGKRTRSTRASTRAPASSW
jgi:hyaluronan synthase